MKRSWMRLLPVCFSIIAIAIFASSAFAQGNGKGKKGGGGNGGGEDPPQSAPIQYRVEYGLPPQDTIRLTLRDMAEVTNGNTSSMIGVGYYGTLARDFQGFLYVHATDQFLDMQTFVGGGLEWDQWQCNSINSSGIAVGAVIDTDTNTRKAVWFDFFAVTPQLHFLEDRFPELRGVNHFAKKINDNGDILIIPVKPDDIRAAMPSPQFLVNPATNESFLLGEFYAKAVNDNRIVVGKSMDQTSTVRQNVSTGVVEVFPQYSIVGDINNQDQFCGATQVQVKRNRRKWYAFRHQGANSSESAEWLSDPFEVINSATSLNNQGDIVGRMSANLGAMTFLHHAGINQTFRLDELVNDAYFNSGGQYQQFVTDQDQTMDTPSPKIAGLFVDANGDQRLFFLIPEDTP